MGANKMTTHFEVGQRIKKLRENKGLEQLDLASMLGYKSQSTISKWESGTNLPTGKNMIKLAQIFGVTSDYILDGETEEKEIPSIDLSNLRERVVMFDGKPLSDNDVEKIEAIIKLSLGVGNSEDK